MNWLRRWWLGQTYQHPSKDFKRLTPAEREEAVEQFRQMLSKEKGGSAPKRAPAPFKPSLHQIAFTQLSVALNASTLTAEARWLRLRGFYARAFVLAKIAQEEFGKIYLLDQAALLVVVQGEDKSWKGFWQSWKNHKHKSYFMKMPFAPNGLSKERLDYEEDVKLAALYVEFGENRISVPPLVVTREMADEMIEICEWSRIHAFAKLRDLPVIDATNGPGPGVEALLSTFLQVGEVSSEEPK